MQNNIIKVLLYHVVPSVKKTFSKVLLMIRNRKAFTQELFKIFMYIFGILYVIKQIKRNEKCIFVQWCLRTFSLSYFTILSVTKDSLFENYSEISINRFIFLLFVHKSCESGDIISWICQVTNVESYDAKGWNLLPGLVAMSIKEVKMYLMFSVVKSRIPPALT